MSAPSFKQLIKDGTIRRADAMRVPYENIFIEPGFNLRDEGPELEQSVEELALFMFEGGQVPPLEVIPVPGGVKVVDGHRRYYAFGKLRQMGAQIDLIDVVPFRGNDVDRIARIMTSAEGRSLSPLETARGYKRLNGGVFNLSAEEIASKVHKTRQHVEQLLILANANADVHALVRKGIVSAAVAIDAVRKHGENAGAFLAGKFDEAKASGATKLTPKNMKPWTPPAKVVAPLVEALDEFSESLDVPTKVAIAEAESRPESKVTISAFDLLQLLKAHGVMIDSRNSAADKAREKAAKAAQLDIEGAA